MLLAPVADSRSMQNRSFSSRISFVHIHITAYPRALGICLPGTVPGRVLLPVSRTDTHTTLVLRSIYVLLLLPLLLI